MQKDATISECGKYRYSLVRRWGNKGGLVVWVMLNPSTADSNLDDPTIRRCMKFTERFGHNAMMVVNLFAFRSSDPRKLSDAPSPIGPENHKWVLGALFSGSLLVAAWGALKLPFPEFMKYTIRRLGQEGYTLKCLGKTKNGSPCHPLYLKGDARLIPWAAPKQ